MGVVNATPDSFYAGSRVPSRREAVDRAARLVDEGADWLDIGGQSTRPGSEPIPAQEELRRVVGVIEEFAGRFPAVPISIDTDKPEVARRAREAGATILNDIAGLRAPGMLEEAVAFEVVILMHMGGSSPKDMQAHARYGDVVKEVEAFLKERRDAYLRAGGEAARLVYDPGIGFGKELEHNLSLIKHVESFKALGPVLLGASRKSFIGKAIGGDDPADRLEGSLAAACYAALRGVDVVRVHDVGATRRALDLLTAVSGAA